MGTKHISFRSTNRAISHSDYCRLLHCTTHSSSALTEEKFMPKALFAALFAFMASASASYAQPPAAPTAKAATAEKTTRMKLQDQPIQPSAETVKVRAVYSPDVRPNPVQELSADEFDPGASGWRSYGMLLATLVLMGVIAVRRFTAGRH
jgi:hypothetical protein